jgi:hypothetical protein
MESVIKTPKHWEKWDIIYIEISFFSTVNLLIDGWGNKNLIRKIDIKSTAEGGILQIECEDNTRVNCLFEWARIERIIPSLLGTP